jgi:hypothetical protein
MVDIGAGQAHIHRATIVDWVYSVRLAVRIKGGFRIGLTVRVLRLYVDLGDMAATEGQGCEQRGQ